MVRHGLNCELAGTVVFKEVDWKSRTLENICNLPGEIISILDRSVGPQPTPRRVPMYGNSKAKHAALGVLVREALIQLPSRRRGQRLHLHMGGYPVLRH